MILIQDALADKSEDGIIAKFVKGVNELHQGEVKPTYDEEDVRNSIKNLNDNNKYDIINKNRNGDDFLYEQRKDVLDNRESRWNIDNIRRWHETWKPHTNDGRRKSEINDQVLRFTRERRTGNSKVRIVAGGTELILKLNYYYDSDVDKSGIQDLIDAKNEVESHGIKVYLHLIDESITLIRFLFMADLGRSYILVLRLPQLTLLDSVNLSRIFIVMQKMKN
ncbi:MAG: hypothetical protein MJ236_05885 [Clostridia bacterium]|nr:hypothetical protein [Clostridia bacterium]